MKSEVNSSRSEISRHEIIYVYIKFSMWLEKNNIYVRAVCSIVKTFRMNGFL